MILIEFLFKVVMDTVEDVNFLQHCLTPNRHMSIVDSCSILSLPRFDKHILQKTHCP